MCAIPNDHIQSDDIDPSSGLLMTDAEVEQAFREMTPQQLSEGSVRLLKAIQGEDPNELMNAIHNRPQGSGSPTPGYEHTRNPLLRDTLTGSQQLPTLHEILTQLPDKLTPADIMLVVKSQQYYVFPYTTTTVCALTLVNDFVVTGESACISPEFFNAEIGRNVAFQKALAKIWDLEAYRIKNVRAIVKLELESPAMFAAPIPK
jgi:hypothetical protein